MSLTSSLANPTLQSAAEVLTLTLLHSTWLLSVIGFVVWLILNAVPVANAHCRYRICLCGSLLCLTTVGATGFLLSEFCATDVGEPAVSLRGSTDVSRLSLTFSSETEKSGADAIIALAGTGTLSAQTTDTRLPNRLPAAATWFVSSVYFAGLLAMLGRLATGVIGGRRLLNQSTTLVDVSLTEFLSQQARALQIRKVPRLATCVQITVPVVCGILRPVILLPPVMITGLTQIQLQAIILHELIHVRRCDAMLILLQRFGEAILFYHPVVWFLGRQLNRERCCDDTVLRSGCDPIVYAESLLRIAEICLNQSHNSVCGVVLAADGHQPSELNQRIRRFLTPQYRARIRVATVLASLMALGLITMAISWLHGERSAVVAEIRSDSMSLLVDPGRAAAGHMVRHAEGNSVFVSLSGRLVDAKQNPIPNATVAVRPVSSWTMNDRPVPAETLALTTTDKDGRFELKRVSSYVPVSSTEHKQFPLEITAFAKGFSLKWTTVIRTPKEPVVLQMQPEGRAEGTVLNEQGQPVPDAVVRVTAILPLTELHDFDLYQTTPRHVGEKSLNLEGSDLVLATRSDAQGRFQLSGLPPSSGVEVMIEAPNIVSESNYLCCNAEHRLVKEAINGKILTSPVRLIAKSGVILQIDVVDDLSGRPIAQAKVTPVIGQRASEFSATSDHQGQVRIPRLAPGRTVTFAVSTDPPQDYLQQHVMVSIPVGQMETKHTVRLQRGIPVEVFVRDAATGQGIPNVAVAYRTINPALTNAVVPQSYSGRDGKLRMLIPERTGELVVTSQPQGYQRPSAAVAITETNSGETTSDDLVLQLAPSRSLFAQALLPDGKPAGVVNVVSITHVDRHGVSISYRPLEVESDPEGSFQLSDIYEQGTIGDVEIPIYIRTRDRQYALVLPGAPQQSTTRDNRLKLILQPTATITGRLLRSTNQPISGIQVWPYRRSVTALDGAGTYESDVEGLEEADVTGPDGRFTLAGIIPGLPYYPDLRLPPFTELQRSQARFTLAPGESLDIGDILLQSSNTTGSINSSGIAFEVPSTGDMPPAEAVDFLVRNFAKDDQEFRRQLSERNGRTETRFTTSDPAVPYMRRFMELAKGNRDSEIELKALIQIVGMRILGGSDTRAMLALKQEAKQRLIESWLDREELATIVDEFIYCAETNPVDLAQRLFSENPHRAVQGPALLVLARIYADADDRTAIPHLQRLTSEFGDLPYGGRYPTIADYAASRLDEIENFNVGQVAPVVTGFDVFGTPFDTSTMNGRIILYNFCLGNVRHFEDRAEALRRLMDKYPERLQIIDVVAGAGHTEPAAGKAVDPAWRIVADPDERIQSQWHVRTWPSSTIVDAAGNIVARQLPDQQVVQTVRALLETTSAQK